MSVGLRTKHFLGRYGRAAAALLAVVGLVALGGAGYVYANPPTEEVTEQVNRQEVESTVNTSAVVVNGTDLYAPGRRLVGRSAYVFEATPNLTLGVRTGLPEGTPVNVTQRLTLRFEATRSGEPFWRANRTLVAEEGRTDDGEFVSTATVNMSSVAERVRTRREQLGDIGGFGVTMRLNVSYDTGRYTGRLTASAPLVITDRAYWLGGDISASRSHSETVTRRVQGSPDPVAYLRLGALGTVSLLGAVGIVYARRTGLTVREVETEVAEQRYEEWISRGQLPTDPDRRYVLIDTLQDLVDLAIDSNKRVIYDPEYDVYAVADGDLVYYFSAGDLQVESWLDM
ncbi:MAG: DUF5305 domain-containing protein [Haloarculaceae archaeon]